MRMLIHPRTIITDPEVRARIVESLETALGSIRPRLDGVDVYLTDVNGPRGGSDKRCRIVAYLPAGRPVVVTAAHRAWIYEDTANFPERLQDAQLKKELPPDMYAELQDSFKNWRALGYFSSTDRETAE